MHTDWLMSGTVYYSYQSAWITLPLWRVPLPVRWPVCPSQLPVRWRTGLSWQIWWDWMQYVSWCIYSVLYCPALYFNYCWRKLPSGSKGKIHLTLTKHCVTNVFHRPTCCNCSTPWWTERSAGWYHSHHMWGNWCPHPAYYLAFELGTHWQTSSGDNHQREWKRRPDNQTGTERGWGSVHVRGHQQQGQHLRASRHHCHC